MDETLISSRLLTFMEQQGDIDVQARRKLAAGSIDVIGHFFFEFAVPSTWHLCDINRSDRRELIFYWASIAKQAVCPECGITSHCMTKTYETRTIQDLPMFSMTVYHKIKSRHFYCGNPACSLKSFIEQHEEIAGKDARLSNRLKEGVVVKCVEIGRNTRGEGGQLGYT